MREYTPGTIRNVAVAGHGGSGKTTLVDALAAVAGSVKRHGTVKDGTSLTDYAPEETAHGYSISLGCAFAEWQDTKLNLIDLPGFADFTGDMTAGLDAADGVVLCVNAVTGVESGTERMFRAAEARRDPVIFVATMLDREHASFERVYEGIKSTVTPRVIPIEVPIGEGPAFRAVLNLFDREAHRFRRESRNGEQQTTPIAADEQPIFDRYYDALIETIAANDDSLLERYLDGGTISRADAMAAMKAEMQRGEIYPLLCCSAELTYGTRAILTKLVELMPTAFEMEELHALRGAEGDRTVEVHADPAAPFAALVFKTVAEPHVGDVSYFRVLSGTVHAGAEVFNATRGVAERMAHLAVPQGRDRLEVPRLTAGDIGCVAKLKGTHTNDTLSTKEHPIRLPGIRFPEPLVHFAVHASTRGDEEKLQAGLHRLHDEDPTFEVSYDPDTHETIVGGLGERHLEISLERLHRKYGVLAELTRPRIAYRETFTATAEGQGRHKKQSGGRGQFGDCWIRITPLPRGRGYAFDSAIKGGVIPAKYLPAIDHGIQESAVRGVLAGYPVVDFAVACYDGSFHTVDSNEMSFKMAGILAFRAVAAKCRPVLLEPIDAVEVAVPDRHVGDVLGHLSGRRAHILGTEPADVAGHSVVRALVPRAELHLYASELSSMTQGRGSYTRRPHGYEPVPADSAKRVIADRHEHAAVSAT
ncbi:MAG: elongation factor G [Gemmatimonadaceae bacterium]|nr:elongation factor G [Gemmatimonadaceae bacterium]